MFLISQELGDKILNYLKDKPYFEVYEMIDGLQRLQRVPDELLNNAEDVLKKITGNADIKTACPPENKVKK